MRHLGREDQNAECVHKADHDGARNEAGKSCKSEHAEENLNEARENDRRQKVLDSVLAHKRGYDQRNRACRSGDHRGSAAEKRHRDGQHH